MKILRVSMTYPSDKVPGMGLPCYYHSEYSNYDELILTLKQNSTLMKSNKINKNIIQINHNDSGLGTINSNLFTKFFRYTRKFLNQYYILWKSKKYIRAFAPDLVHVYSPVGFQIGLYAKRKFKSKFVMSLHGTDIERLKNSKLLSRIMKYPDKIISVSEVADEKLKNTKFYNGIETIGNGFESSVFFNKGFKREKQIINVGNLRWQKDHEILIKAFSKVLINHPDYRLIIVGDGDKRDSITKLLESLGITKNVTLTGTLQREEISNKLNESRFFVLSSVLEGFPKVVLESMACGTPVVSFDIGNVSSVIKDSGIIVKERNLESLYNAMTELIENNEKLDQLSKLGSIYAKRYDWKSVVTKLESIYSKLVDF